jgi:hypothetical protein
MMRIQKGHLRLAGSLNTIVIIVAIIIFSGELKAHEYEHAKAVAFDRGLTSVYEPFAPSNNPALLTLKDRFRFHVESVNPGFNSFALSLVYPVSPFTGFGFTYFSKNRDTIKDVPQGIYRVIQKDQSFLFSLGYNSWIKWGQFFELNYSMNRFSTLSAGTRQQSPFSNDQYIKCSYRLGLFKSLAKGISVGILTAPILQFNHQMFEDSEKSAESNLSFFEKKISPMAAIQWNASGWLSLALSNRSKYGRDDVQLAFEFSSKRFLLSGAVYNRGALKKPGYIVGLGCYVGGVNVFSSYDLVENNLRFAASFAPEENVELVEVGETDFKSRVFYPYHLKYINSHRFFNLTLQRKTAKPVELFIKLTGRNLPPIYENFTLNQPITIVSISAPVGLMHLEAGNYSYTMEITAYQRSRQTIRQSILFEIKDKHRWSGHTGDLVYFLTPENEKIMAKARQAALSGVQINSDYDVLKIVENIYEFMRDNISYFSDPQLIHDNQDWIQYPVETLDSKSGDCEDLAILFASMLQSVGINTAFAEYIIPGADEGHVFLLFDSKKNASGLFANNENLQNYIIRPHSKESKYFIPIELTRSDLSFTQSRKYAIAIYNKYAVEQKGLADGWFHIIDVH